MAKLSAAERRSIPKKLFGLPEKAPKSGSYPIEDKKHAKAALSEAAKHATPAEEKRIRSKVHKLYPSIGMDPSKMRPLSGLTT